MSKTVVDYGSISITTSDSSSYHLELPEAVDASRFTLQVFVSGTFRRAVFWVEYSAGSTVPYGTSFHAQDPKLIIAGQQTWLEIDPTFGDRYILRGLIESPTSVAVAVKAVYAG